jgi:hypothetical protein
MSPLRRAVDLRGLIAVAALALSGCGGAGDELPREPISGTVTFDGRPLASGTIQLQPATGRESVASGGMVTEGRFNIPRPEGPVPGKYSVAIFAAATSDSSSAEGNAPDAPTPKIRRSLSDLRGTIPPRYNVQTGLTAEVKAGGPNHYTFDLKK